MKSLKPITRLVSILILVVLGMTLTSITVLAHERRSVDKYQLVVGFINEPAIEGQKNGVDFRVTNTSTNQPVNGLEKTVQVEITHVPSNTSKVFPIRAIFNDPGHYTNDLILTAPGQFKFRFFGNIEGMPLNETFTSGPGTFSDAGPSADLQFPLQLPQTREITSAVTGAQNSAQQAQTSASQADKLGTFGIVLGAVGIVIGTGALITNRRRR